MFPQEWIEWEHQDRGQVLEHEGFILPGVVEILLRLQSQSQGYVLRHML